MMAVDGDPPRLEQRGECAQLDRGILRVAERHIDERHCRSVMLHGKPMRNCDRRTLSDEREQSLRSSSHTQRSQLEWFKRVIVFGGHVKVDCLLAIDLVRPDLD